MNDKQSLGDATMLALFRAEVETHTATLNDNLEELHPNNRDGIDLLEQAAQCIEGAAKIVNIDMAADLSSKMKETFASIKSDTISPHVRLVDQLLEGTALLKQMGELAFDETADELRALESQNQAIIDHIASESKINTTSAKKKEPGIQSTSAPKKTEVSSMMGLFLAETETHIATLNEGILSIEKDPTNAKELASLMRAAHSIKGAARIVNIDCAVNLAHAMEDIFVAAQKDEIVIDPAISQILFCGADLIEDISKEASEGSDISDKLQENITNLINALSIARTGGEFVTPVISSPKKEKSSTSKASQDRQDQQDKQDKQDNVIRISAEKIDQMMDLAGEIMVRGKRLNHFSTVLKTIENQITSINVTTNHIHDSMVDLGDHLREQLGDLLNKHASVHSELLSYINEFDDFAFDLDILSSRMHQEAISSRMRPFSEGVAGFPRMVRDISKSLGKDISFEIIGKDTKVDRNILKELETPITHLLRNAIDHGLEDPETRATLGKPKTGQLKLKASHLAGQLLIIVEDDGQGINVELLRKKIVERGLTNRETSDKLTDDELFEFMFLPGFSTTDSVTELSGRGVGMDVVAEMFKSVSGTIQIDTKQGQGTKMRMLLPLTLSVIRSLVFELDGQSYAFPLSQIHRCFQKDIDDITKEDHADYTEDQGELLQVIDGRRVLHLERLATQPELCTIIVIGNSRKKIGMLVDTCTGEFDLVIKPLDARLGPIPCLSSSSIMENGRPVLSLDVDDTLRMVDKIVLGEDINIDRTSHATSAAKRILVVEDSITVREMERKMLEKHGFNVDIAIDGIDGWNAITTAHYDLVVSDVDMPRMDGIEFVSRVRAEERFDHIPILFVSYKDTAEDRKRGLSAGADHYITKNSFHDNSIMQTIATLLKDGRK